jgi:hypothetical protein
VYRCVLQVAAMCPECAGVMYFGVAGRRVWGNALQPTWTKRYPNKTSNPGDGEVNCSEESGFIKLVDVDLEEDVGQWESEDPLGGGSWQYVEKREHRRYIRVVDKVDSKDPDTRPCWCLSPNKPKERSQQASPCMCVETLLPPHIQKMQQETEDMVSEAGAEAVKHKSCRTVVNDKSELCEQKLLGQKLFDQRENARVVKRKSSRTMVKDESKLRGQSLLGQRFSDQSERVKSRVARKRSGKKIRIQRVRKRACRSLKQYTAKKTQMRRRTTQV